MAILWLLLLAFKDLEKYLLLIRTEEAIKLYFDRGGRQMKLMLIRLHVVLGVMFSSFALAEYQGRYCEMDGVYTESGEPVYGEFYMWSDKYGESDGAYTSSGESVHGECYRYSGRYCEMDGAYTDSGESVSGECYIY
jgi:hypothetical protein